MRIFTAVRHARDPALFYGGLWSGNFYPALRTLGHEIVESEVDLLPTSRFMHVGSDFTPQELEARARTTQAIIDEVTRAHRDKPIGLFLSYFYNAHFDPGGFAQLRALGIPTVNFYCNSIYQFELVDAVAAAADFSWHPEKEARASYLAAGARPVWVQMGADPEIYRPVDGIERQGRVAFIGQRYADRDRWLAAAIEAGLPLDIYGAGWSSATAGEQIAAPASYLGRGAPVPGTWPSYREAARQIVRRDGAVRGMARLVRQWRYRNETQRLTSIVAQAAKGSVPEGKFAETVAGYAVHINLSNVWADGRPCSALVPHVRLRDFEIPMCRAAYLTAHTAEIEDCYDTGKEIETYRSREEFIDKARYLVTHPAHAERLRQAGYARARVDHTWARRMALLFDRIGL